MLRRSIPWLVALAAFAHALSYLGHGPCDDDYIAYRYARNLVEGFGPVFNAGERVEGFSAPGWMLLIAMGLKLGFDPASVSIVVSAVCAGVCAWAIARLWLRTRPDAKFAAPAWLVAFSPAVAWHAIVGLGTVPLAALLALAFDAWERAEREARTAWAAAIAFGLAALVRNEAVLLAAPFVVFALRRRSFGPAVLACLPLAAWQIFRLAYYGRLVPITYTVKKLGFVDDLRLGLEYLAMSNATTGLLFGLAFGLVALARSRGSASAVLPGAVLGTTGFCAYVVYVGGDFMPHARFFVPALPLVAWVGCEGFARLFPGRVRWAPIAFAVVVGWTAFLHDRRKELFELHRDSEQRWEMMGRTVAASVPSDTKVALAPIGAFGWVSRLYIVDLLGLTNTAIAEAPPDPEITIKGHTRHDAEWVLAQRPEMIIIGTAWLHPGADGAPTLNVSAWERTLVAHPRFASDYTPLVLEVHGSYPLLFYWRKDAARPRGAREV